MPISHDTQWMHLAGYLAGIMGISTSHKALDGGLYQIQTINTLQNRVLESHNRIALEVLLFGQLLFVPKSSNFGKGYGIKSGAVGNIKIDQKKRNTLRTWGTCGKNTLGTHVHIHWELDANKIANLVGTHGEH